MTGYVSICSCDNYLFSVNATGSIYTYNGYNNIINIANPPVLYPIVGITAVTISYIYYIFTIDICGNVYSTIYNPYNITSYVNIDNITSSLSNIVGISSVTSNNMVYLFISDNDGNIYYNIININDNTSLNFINLSSSIVNNHSIVDIILVPIINSTNYYIFLLTKTGVIYYTPSQININTLTSITFSIITGSGNLCNMVALTYQYINQNLYLYLTNNSGITFLQSLFGSPTIIQSQCLNMMNSVVSNTFFNQNIILLLSTGMLSYVYPPQCPPPPCPTPTCPPPPCQPQHCPPPSCQPNPCVPRCQPPPCGPQYKRPLSKYFYNPSPCPPPPCPPQPCPPQPCPPPPCIDYNQIINSINYLNTNLNKTEVISAEALSIAKHAQCSANKAVKEINNTNDVLVKSIVKECETNNYLNCKINSIELLLQNSQCNPISVCNPIYKQECKPKPECIDSETESDVSSINSSISSKYYISDYPKPFDKKKKHKTCKKHYRNPCIKPCINPCINPCRIPYRPPCYLPYRPPPCYIPYRLPCYNPLQRNVCDYVRRINPGMCY